MRTALVLLLIGLATSARASFTFCVAESGGGKQIWLSDVFTAEEDRLRLETDFKALLRKRGVADAVVQCPAPVEDKTDAVNAQFVAADFHRKLGDALHAIAFPDAPGRH